MRPRLIALLSCLLLAAGPALAQSSFGLPVDGKLGESFGTRIDPKDGQPKFHRGLDFLAPDGTPVKAAESGTVGFAGDQPGFGLVIRIDHADGLATRYAHLSRADVKVGDAVARGQVIGAVGHSGQALQPHLHFEVLKDGEPQNPVDYLPVKP